MGDETKNNSNGVTDTTSVMAHIQEPTAGARPYLLVVEDSATALAVLSKNLSERFDLISAQDGEEAWGLLQADKNIELVITDINMPKLTGHQLLARIRKSDDRRIADLPVFVMTTNDDDADKHLAFLNGANDFITKPIDPMELQARVNVHHKLATTIRELDQIRVELTKLASTDPLTMLHNRRTFFEQGKKAVSLARRYHGNCSVILLDLDHFKKINDTHGHHAGDAVLVEIANLLTGLTREVDSVARVGGEEFAILLPDTSRLGAAVLAERIRTAVANRSMLVDGKTIRITTSLGLAAVPTEPVDDFQDLMKIADRRLYLAKELGRNRICVNDDGKQDFSPLPL